MKLLLLLGLLLCVSAQDLHRDTQISACSDSDKESMYGLDGEVIAYADFEKQEEVYPQPNFVDRMESPGAYAQAVANLPICQANMQFFKEQLKDIPLELDPPGVPLIYPRDQILQDQTNTLVCQASGFYPAPVKFFWTKDQQNVSSTVVTQAYLQPDGTFTQFSRLDITPREGQVYSCSLEHPALGPGERRTRLWTVEVQGPGVGASVFCAVGLTLGLVGVAVGTFFLVKGNECR